MDSFPLFYTVHFYLFGLIAIVAAVVFVTRRSPVAAAMWLVVVMFCLAVEYVMLDAQFIGAMQVLVYAGAIMVVFLFVIMLLNLGQASEISDARGLGAKLLAGFVGLVLIAETGILSRTGVPTGRYVRSAQLRRRPGHSVRCGGRGREAALSELFTRVRADEHPAARRDRERGDAWPQRRRRCSLSHSDCRRSCSR